MLYLSNGVSLALKLLLVERLFVFTAMRLSGHQAWSLVIEFGLCV